MENVTSKLEKRYRVARFFVIATIVLLGLILFQEILFVAFYAAWLARSGDSGKRSTASTIRSLAPAWNMVNVLPNVDRRVLDQGGSKVLKESSNNSS